MQVMDLSTAHLRPYQRAGLTRLPGVIAYTLLDVDDDEIGYLLHVPVLADEDAETAAWLAQIVPPEVQAVIDYGRRWGCDFVRLDRDADMVDDLPTYGE
jgi:hypothetical protein